MAIQKLSVVAMLAVFCCILWGSAFPGIKVGYEWLEINGAGSQILFAGWRFFLAGAMTFIIFSIKEREIIRIKTKSILPVVGQGILQTSVQYFFFYIGLSNTTGARGSVITATNAFFSIITAHFIIKGEKLNLRKAVGCIMGFLGVIIVNLTTDTFELSFSLKGEGFVLLCAIAYGVSTVTTKLISKYEKPETITAYQLMIGGGILTLIGYLWGGEIGNFDFKSGILFFYLAFLSTVAFTIWAALLKYNPVGRVAPFGFTIPIFGTALSGVFLHESIFTVNNLFALILVCSGILWVNLEKRDDIRNTTS